MCFVPEVLQSPSPKVERKMNDTMTNEEINVDSSSSSASSEGSSTPRCEQSKPAVFVHDPYTWYCPTSPSYTADESEAEAQRIRIFCSGKGIPHASNEEFLAQLGPVAPFVLDVFRPRGGRKEFLYVELSDELAVEVLLSYHPMKFRGQRLNISMAKPNSVVNA